MRHLRAFAAVAESRSFSKAARLLRIAQPPLSRHIRQLENELGVKLFVRTTSGVYLTCEGTVLLEKARDLLAHAAGFLELAARMKNGTMSLLKVGIAPGLGEAVNRIRLHLQERQPEISIEGLDVVSGRQYDALRQGSIDIGVLRHVDERTAVESEPLFEERFVVILSDRHPLSKRRSLHLKQLADVPLLLHERAWAPLAHDKILALYGAAGVEPEIVTLHAEPGDQASMLAVASGDGVCLALRGALSRSYVTVSGLAVVPLDEPDAVLQVRVAWRRGQTSKGLENFVAAAHALFPVNNGIDRDVHARRS
jgi:DNA-binding transcriptional LysR family regulator